MAEPTILSQIIQIRTQIYNTQIRKYADTHIHKGVSQYTKESERSLGHDSGAILSQIIQIQTQIHNKQIYKHTNTQIRKNTNTQIQGGLEESERSLGHSGSAILTQRRHSLTSKLSPSHVFFLKDTFHSSSAALVVKPPKSCI